MQMSKTEMPSIRFYGFDNDWEQRKLGELALFNPKDELPQTFEYVDLESVVGTEMLSHRTEVKSSAPSRAQRLAHTGDLFYQTVRPYQKNNYLFEKPDNNYVFSTGYAQMRPYVDGYFLLSLVQSERFVKVVLDNCTGTSYPAINANDLAEIEVAAPSNEKEAQKIGTIFRSIDNLITLHQRKFEKLTNVKKSILEKMFPRNGSSYPEIRFKGFTDPWEQRKFGEVATFINGRAYSQPELLSSGKYKVLRVGNFYTNDSWYYSDLELGEKYYADYGDLLYTWSATFGPHIWLGDRVIYHYHIWKISLSDQLEKQFAVQLLEQDRANILSSKNGSTMVHITKEGMEQKDVIIPPSTKEQQKIGAFFSQLDDLITLHQRELEKLQSIKKALLEKMFV
jgi:type I restriction enzyme S subunit